MRPKRVFDSANRFVLDHTKVAYVLWALLLFFMADSLLTTAPLDEPSIFGLMAWVVVAELVATPIVVLRISAVMGTARETLILRWIVSNVPVLFALAAVYDRAPQWLGAIAVVEALALMMYSVRQARRSLGVEGSEEARL